MPHELPKLFSWELYETLSGASPVRDEIRAVLNDKASLIALGQLMSRLEYGRTLPRDTRPLRSGLFEARLTEQGNEYRLYYGHAAGRGALLALHFHRKGGQGAQHRAIARARLRLAEWYARDIR